MPERLRPGEPLSPCTEEGVEVLGHDVRGARTAVSADGGMIAGPAICARHGRSPSGKSEDVAVPLTSLSPQDLTVSNFTHNAGSQETPMDNLRGGAIHFQ